MKIYWGIKIARKKYMMKKKSLTQRKSDEALKLHMLQIHKQKKKKDSGHRKTHSSFSPSPFPAGRVV